MRCSPNDSSDDFRLMQVVFTYIRGALSDRVIDDREDRDYSLKYKLSKYLLN